MQKQYAFPFVGKNNTRFLSWEITPEIANLIREVHGGVLHRKVLQEIARPKNNAEIIVWQIKQYRNHCVGNFMRPAKIFIMSLGRPGRSCAL